MSEEAESFLKCEKKVSHIVIFYFLFNLFQSFLFTLKTSLFLLISKMLNFLKNKVYEEILRINSEHKKNFFPKKNRPWDKTGHINVGKGDVRESS